LRFNYNLSSWKEGQKKRGGDFVDDFSKGNPDAKWEARFNINIGYYF